MVWDALDGSPKGSIRITSAPVRDVSWHPSAPRLAAASWGSILALCEFSSSPKGPTTSEQESEQESDESEQESDESEQESDESDQESDESEQEADEDLVLEISS